MIHCINMHQVSETDLRNVTACLWLHLQLTCRSYFVPSYRVGVSSEDETKAVLTIPEPSCASPSFPSRLSSNDNNPFISNLGQEVKTLGSDSFGGPSLNLSSPPENNPFIVKWEQGSKAQDSESSTATAFSLSSPSSSKENNPFSPHWRQESPIEDSGSCTKSLLYLPHPPTPPVLESYPLPSQLPNVDSPFESKLREESEHINNPPTPLASPPATFSQEHDSSAGNLIDSKKCPAIPLEEPQNEGLTNIDPISSLSGSYPEHFCNRTGLILKMQHEDQDFTMVAPLKENNGSMKKKSVTFAVVEREDYPVSSGDEMSDEDSVERWQDENEDAENSTERNRGLELEAEHGSVPKSYDGRLSSDTNIEVPLEKCTEINSPVKIDPPLPTPRVLTLSQKENNMLGTELSGSSSSVPPKPAPRSALKQDKRVLLPETDIPETDTSSSAPKTDLLVENPSETPTTNCSLTTPISSEQHPRQKGGAVESSESINSDHPSCEISTWSAGLITGDLNQKPAALPVIPEVGSDDEQLSESQKDAEKMGVCEDLSKTKDRSLELWSLVEGRRSASNKATDKQTYSLLARMPDLNDDALESNKALIKTVAAGLQNISCSTAGSEPKGEIKESECSEPSDRPVSLSSLSSSAQPHPTSSFHSEPLGSDRAESPKKTAVEGLDAKLEISGKKKLLQAWVSPSEIQPSQALQSGGTQPAKLR